MKKPSVSRRKFLTGLGVAAGAAAMAPTAKSLGAGSKSKGSLLDAWMRPRDTRLYPVQILNRQQGSYMLPLTQRPL
jgi:hypothetical protein